MTALTGIGGERYWVHIPATKPRAYKKGGLVAAAKAVKGSPMANELGDTELVHVNKYEMEQLREMWGEPGINPETGLPAYGLFKVIKKIAGTVAKIGATVVLTPVLGPVAASAVVNAAATAIGGGDIGDIVKSAGIAAATAGAAQAGAKFAPDLGISKEVGRAIGAGIGTTGAGLATGQSFTDSLYGGALAGIGTYGTNRMLGTAIEKNTLGIGDAYNYLTNVGKDISNITGIGGPPGGYTSRMDIKAVEGAPDIRAYGDSVTQMPGADIGGDIVVTGTPNTNVIFGAGGYKMDASGKGTGGIDETAVREDYTAPPEDILVTGKGTDFTIGNAPNFRYNPTTGQVEEIKETYTPPPEEIIVTGSSPAVTVGGIGNYDTTNGIDLINADITETDDGTILVNGTPVSELTLTPPPAGTKKDVDPNKKDDEIVVTGTNPAITPSGEIFDPDKPGGVGELPPIYPSPVTPAGPTIVPNLVPRGGLYAETPMNRGLASIGFDPFTYGQTVGAQPGEFLFFTESGRPYGSVGAYTGAAANRVVSPAVEAAVQRAIADEVAKEVVKETAVDTEVDTDTTPATDTGGSTNTPTTTTGFTGKLTLSDVPRGDVPLNTLPLNLPEKSTPANTGYTAAQLAGRQTYYDLMRDPNIAQFTSNINKTIANQLSANKISQEQARGINEQLQALYQTPGTTQEAIRGLATTALRDAAKAFASTNPVAAVSAAQNPDSASYVAGTGPADVYAPVMAEGGEVEDDMVKHLLEYRKGGGHQGPGRVKGIGSGQEDKIPAWLSDGEYVWSAQDVADLGDGSTDEGVRRLDKMRQMVRKRAGRKDVKKIAKPQHGIDKMLKAVGGAV